MGGVRIWGEMDHTIWGKMDHTIFGASPIHPNSCLTDPPQLACDRETRRPISNIGNIAAADRRAPLDDADDLVSAARLATSVPDWSLPWDRSGGGGALTLRDVKASSALKSPVSQGGLMADRLATDRRRSLPK